MSNETWTSSVWSELGPVTCPACRRAVAGAPVERFTAEEAAGHFVAPSRSAERNARCRAAIERQWQGRVCEVYVCGSCGMGFGWPHVGGSDEFYSIIHEQADYPPWRWEYPRVAEHAARVFPQGGLALDVGAGHGVFAKHLKSGWTYYANELGDVLRMRLEERGHKTFATLGDAERTHAGKFSLIVLFQVLQHVAEFDGMLAALRKLAAPGAILAMSMPYGPEIMRRGAATKCPDMPPNHINRWTPGAVEAAVARAGFKLESHEVQQPKLKNMLYSAYLRTIVEAARDPSSISGRWYSIKNKKLRIAAAAPVAALQLARMAPRLGDAMLSVNFLTYSRAV